MTVSTKLALFLANRAADYIESERPVDTKTTLARFEGAAEAIHLALGLGLTPFAVQLRALDFIKANGRPAAGAAFPTKRAAWSEKAQTVLLADLESLA